MLYNKGKMILIGGNSNNYFSGFEIIPMNKEPIFVKNKFL